jgi:RNA polymerase sigma-70 factor (ECF subfamily)
MSIHTDSFEPYRPLLFSIAYRMLGSVMEAEDIVQEAYLRFLATPVDEIRSAKAYLTTITTRLCLDQLKAARSKREAYIGPWLPEPLATEESPAEVVDKHEMISMAFLVLLENLAPVERAVFLLREVFDYDYAEIAPIVGKSESNCRQLYHRAKQYLTARRPRFQVTHSAQEQLLQRFVHAVGAGKLEELTTLLADDVMLWSDGGGKATAARRPIAGRDAVAKFLVGLNRMRTAQTRSTIADINGAPAILIYEGELLIVVMTFVNDGEKIYELHNVLNPDKLGHLRHRGA